jgi:preprotein translocase subunit SecY
MTEGNVPKAVATGIAAPPSVDAVNPHRTGLIIGVLAVAVVSAMFATSELPGRVLALVGGAEGGVARYGGVIATYTPPPGVEPQLAEGAGDADNDIRVYRNGDHWMIELPRVTEANAPTVIARLSRGGGLEFREVIESRAANELVTLGLAFDDQEHHDRREPTLLIDSWRPEDGSDRRTDLYLYAHSRELLDHAFSDAQARGWTPPPHTKIVYERIDPPQYAKDRSTTWRSYFVADEVALDGSAVANATGTYDRNTNQPVVSLEFTRRGARTFGELTERIVGHKLAMLLGGEVKSAPVINTAIRGGRAQITLGGSDSQKAEADRDALVETLKTGSLPLAGNVSDAKWVAPSGGGSALLARVLLAALAGGLGFLVAFGLVRLARPEHRRSAELPGTTGAKVGRKLAWTAFPILVYIAGTWITAPGINDVELGHVARVSGGHFDSTQFSILALGVMPLLTSFVTVEIFASLVRPWRKLRDTVVGRRKLGLAVAIVAVLISAIQAYFVTTYLDSMSRGGAEVFDSKLFWPCVATLAAGPMLVAVLASTISTRGLGNGYAVMFVAAWLWSIPWFDLTANAQLVLAATIVVATVAITLGMLGWRVRAPGRVAVPLPASSIAPIHDGGGALALIGTISALGVTLPYWVLDKVATLRGSLTIGLVVLALAAAFWAFVFARPGRRRAELAAAKQEPADRALWLRALAITIAALAALFALALIRPSGILGKLSDPAIVVIAAATLADLFADARAHRHANLVAVWPLHDPLLVDVARDVLGDIPHVIQATRLRTLLWIFGSYAPMVVLVPEPQSGVAHAKLKEWFTPQ